MGAAVDAGSAAAPHFTYPEDATLQEKIEAVAKRIYHAGSVAFTDDANKALTRYQQDGYGRCPVCIAKTQYSMTEDKAVLGAPEGFELTIRSARLSAGAGFVVAFAGGIIAMPGLPKQPAALTIDVNENGDIEGLF